MAGFSFRTFRSRNQPRRFPDEHVSLDTPRRRTISAAMAFARRTWIATALAALCAGPASARDRKSTRLNSSHSQISYAVFCLKKKKKLLLIARDDFTASPALSRHV